MSDSLREMVERVEWFSPVDYEILQFYENHDILASAKVIGANIDYSRQYVNKRLVKLSDSGILESTDGLYRLSATGKEFLTGNLEAENLTEPDD